MEYIDQKCPVCGQPFSSDSDVVVCPECGTPHHRECYAQSGFCANSARHKDGYSYYQAERPPEKPPEKPKDDAYAPADSPSDKGKPSPMGLFGVYAKDEGYGVYKGEAVKSERDIGGITAGEYGTFLGKAARTYIPRFLYLEETGKKIIWNVVAFFLPYTFAASKKMYKAAMLLLAVDMFFFGFSVYSSLKKEPAKAFAEQLMLVYEDGKLTDEEVELLSGAMQKINETEINRDWTDAVLELRYLDNIVMGLLATYFYKKDCARKLTVLKNAPVPPEVVQATMRRTGKTAVLLPLMGYIAIAVTVVSTCGWLINNTY